MTDKRYRIVLPLSKGRVVHRDGHSFKIAIGGSTTITVTPQDMGMLDIRDGDILTLYTEVYLAIPSESSIQ